MIKYVPEKYNEFTEYRFESNSLYILLNHLLEKYPSAVIMWSDKSCPPNDLTPMFNMRGFIKNHISSHKIDDCFSVRCDIGDCYVYIYNYKDDGSIELKFYIFKNEEHY